jgi:tRNA threonylcarbamoyladenosine biosynthesis protein TsaE
LEFQVVSRSAEQTRKLGFLLGTRITTGLAIRLHGDLGGGKTCFVQGLAMGLDVPPTFVVASPTYTLINEYPARLPLVHVDLYRLGGSLDAEFIGLWDYFETQAVVAVEWAERLPEDQWPMESLCVRFQITSDTERRILIFGYGLEQDNLIKNWAAEWNRLIGRDR